MEEQSTAQAQGEEIASNGSSEEQQLSEDLGAQLASANAKAEDNYNRLLLAMADFENYKKRIERQFSDIALVGRKSLLEKFLPVLDNLE